MAGRFENGVNVTGLRIDKGVDEVLAEAGRKLEGLDAVVWRWVPFLSLILDQGLISQVSRR